MGVVWGERLVHLIVSNGLDSSEAEPHVDSDDGDLGTGIEICRELFPSDMVSLASKIIFASNAPSVPSITGNETGVTPPRHSPVLASTTLLSSSQPTLSFARSVEPRPPNIARKSSMHQLTEKR